MDWIFEHFRILVAVAGVIAYLLQKKRASGGGTADPEDMEEAARMRRVQEQIRRKIAERRGEAAPAQPAYEPSPAPPVMEEPRAWGETMPEREQEKYAPVAPPVMASTAAILERQNELAEQMRALEVARASAQKRASELAAVRATEARDIKARSTGDFLNDLRDAKNLRRAIVLREVLSPPVALR